MRTYKITFRKQEWGRYFADLLVAVPDDIDPMTLLDGEDGGDLPCELHDAIEEWEWQNGSEDEEIVGAKEVDMPPDAIITRDEDGCLAIADEEEVLS